MLMILYLKFKGGNKMARNIHVLHIGNIQHLDSEGNVLWEDSQLHNILHDEGEQFILSAAFATTMVGFGPPPASLYLGLDTSTRTLGEADTLALVTENISANGYNRIAVSTAGDGGSAADFYITQPSSYYQAQSKIVEWTAITATWTTVQKLFLTTAATGTTGLLIATVPLSTARTLAVGDTIRCAMYIGLSE